MKSFFLLTVTFIISSQLCAQPWVPQDGKTAKLEEIINAYNRHNISNDKIDNEELLEGKVRKEGKNYHFDRWTWYWQHHLDEHGNLASPMRTYEAWKAYNNRQASGKKFKITNQSQWSFIGPTTSPGGYNGMGRINDIGFHPTDSNTFIVATAGGGAWRTTDGGINWTCLTDQLPVLGTSDVVYNPLNPNTIYVCTGDKDASDTYSIGLLKSTDGGITWDTTALQFKRSDLRLTNSLVINPLDTNSLILATNYAILKSFDGGQTWLHTISGHFKEVLYHPTDTNIIYAASYSPASIFRSADGGSTWQLSSTFSNSIRVSIAVTPAAPNIVKAVVATSNHALHGIYNSTDTGKTFTSIFGAPGNCNTNILSGSATLSNNSCSGQGWYDLAIAISPLDENKVYVGGVNTYHSLDGGYTWDLMTQWTFSTSQPTVKVVHADKHKLAFNPLNPQTLYECNDGGLYKSYSANAWFDLSNGLQITQFYRIAGSDQASFVLAGSQDNGTKRVRFNGAANELTGGDGMDCQIDYTDTATFYTSSQYGNFRRTTNNGANFTNISNNIPGNPSGAWITPLMFYAGAPSVLLAGYAHLFMSPDQGDNWYDISPNFSNSTNITRISVTPQDPNRIFVLQGSVIRYTKDIGNNWSSLPFGFGGDISDILIDPTDTNRIFVTYSGYGSNKVAQYYFGAGWSKIQDSIPDVPVHCIAYDLSNNTLYIGTDLGVFYKDPSMAHWEAFNNGLPVIEVTDLSINYATNELWAATYGRGVWKSPKHTTPAGVPSLPLALDVINVSPNPNKGQCTISTANNKLVNQKVSVRIISYSGTNILHVESKFDSAGKLAIDAGSLATGTYIVEVITKGNVAARTKMMVL